MASPGGRIGKEVTEMNFKTLTAIGAAATVAGLLAAPQAQADGTAWIYDSSGSGPGNPGTYSHTKIGSGDTGDSGWVDVIGSVSGSAGFDTSAIKVEWIGTDVRITTYTNYSFNAFGGNVALASWLFDTDLAVDGKFEYAVNPSSNTAGTYGAVDSTESSADKMGPLGYGSGQYSHNTAICDASVAGACDANNRLPEVYANLDSNTTSAVSITYDTTGGNVPGFPAGLGVGGVGAYAHSYSFLLAGVNAGGEWDSFRVFWGTGWCANDTIEGGVSNVPIPAAAWLFGSAILGLGAVGWKRRSPAA
jgi:hypothetical protein